MVTFLATPIGNIEDITIRTLRALENCEVILCEDTRVSKKLISILVDRKFITPKDYKYISYHTHNEKSFLDSVEDNFFEKDIVFLSDAGMPCISDPGVELVRYLQSKNIDYDVFGGISASTLAVAFSGMVDKEFIFTGFCPHKIQDKRIFFGKLLSQDYPIVVYESPHRLLDTIGVINEMDPNVECFLAKELSKKFQMTYRGRIDDIYVKLQDVDIKGEWVMILRSNLISSSNITESEIMTMDIPPKIKSKIISKMSGKPVKDIYLKLCEKES